MRIFRLNILAFFLLFVVQYNTFALQDVTTDLFGAENYGTVAAFGDFNSDKQTDIFIIRKRTLMLQYFLSCYLITRLYKLRVVLLNDVDCNLGMSR